ncbi:UPF0766 protein C6orf228-like [Tropilaelaps mercedesae]|uniref:UPF0766 protein C6orf228-like n=1 Tax=Tropilaelaps mercedesae TaxID=418985 RepID=A0A1V9Y3V3_9ACAR|nr:UPF0766 protein C6orf228-like [Tropilaelaps mercedesae]
MLEQITSVCIYVISVALSLLLLVLLIALGWLFVWKVFLSRFKFVRELVNGSENVACPPGSRRSPPHRRSFGVSSILSPSEATSSTVAQVGSGESAQPGRGFQAAGSSRASGQRRRPRVD